MDRIKALSEKKENENWQFRAFLKGTDMPSESIDGIVHTLYEEASSQIDCQHCANCCKHMRVPLDEKDVENLSKVLGVPAVRFRKQYLSHSEESDAWVFKETPCPFLKDNRCSHYNERPKECRSYPHLHKNDFVFRLIGVIHNSAICPIVFNVYEYLKVEIWPVDEFEYFDDFD